MAGVEKKIKLKRYTGSGTDWDTILPATKADIVTLDPSVTIHGVSQSNVQSAIVQLNTYKVDTGAVLLKVNNTDVTPSDNPVKNVYAPSTGGTADSYARSTGSTSAPAWQYPVTDLEGSGITDSTTVLPTTGGVRTYVKNKLTGVYKPKGSSATIPSLSSVEVGDVYDISVAFSVGESDTNWVESARGKSYPAGTNIVAIDDNGTTRWDVLSGIVNWKKLTINKQGTNIEYDGSVAKSVAIGNGALKLKRNGISLRGYSTEFTADSGSDITVNFNDIDDIADVPASDVERYFNFRPAALMPNPYGDISLIANSERLNKVVANSIKVQQLITNGNFTSLNNWSNYSNFNNYSVSNNILHLDWINGSGSSTNIYQTMSTKVVVDHYYAIFVDIKTTKSVKCNMAIGTVAGGGGASNLNTVANIWQNYYEIVKPLQYTNDNFYFRPNTESVTDVSFDIKNVMIFDLTNMLGASLTDYIVSLETAKKGDGMFLLKGILPLDYYDNTPLMVDTPNYYYETTGTNIWDEVWEVGGLNISTGANDDTRTNRIRSKDFVRVIPNKQYYWHITNRASGNGLGWCYFYDINKNFLSRNSYNSITSAVISISSDCYFIRFETYEGYGNLYNKDVQICLHSLDETYQDLFEKVYHPYKKSTALIDWSWTTTGKGKSAGSVADEINFDSNQGIERVGHYTFTGNETFNDWGDGSFWWNGIKSVIKIPETSAIKANIVSDSLTTVDMNHVSTSENSIAVYGVHSSYGGLVFFHSSSITTASGWKTFLTGKTINYELATPTYHQLSDYQAKQWYIQNYGTEYLYPVNTSSPFSIPYTYITYSNKVYEVGNSDRLDGKTGDYYLDYNNFNNTPSSLPNPYNITFIGKEPGGGTTQQVLYNGSVARTIQVGTNDTNEYGIYPTLVDSNTLRINLGYHGSSATKFGIGTTSLYGHNKLKTGEILNRNIHITGSDSAVATETDGVSASGAHTHFDLNIHEQLVEDTNLFKISGLADNLNIPEKSIVEVEGFKGQSYVYNEKVKNGNFTSDANWSLYMSSYASLSIADNTATVTITSSPSAAYMIGLKQISLGLVGGHVYYVHTEVKPSADVEFKYEMNSTTFASKNISANKYNSVDGIITLPSTLTEQSLLLFPNTRTSGFSYTVSNVIAVDLTQFFNGSIPSDVTDAHPENFFKYYTGTLPYLSNPVVINFNPVGIKTSNINIWDEEWESGKYNNNTGEKEDNAYSIRSKSTIRIDPNTQYYSKSLYGIRLYYYDKNKQYLSTALSNNAVFTTPANAYYMNFNTGSDVHPVIGYDHDICINISDASINGTYFPHEESQRTINISSIKDSNGNTLFPYGLCKVGTIYDEVTKTRAIKRIGVVDLGSLDYNYDSSVPRFYAVLPVKASTSNLLCTKYAYASSMNQSTPNMSMFVSSNTTLSLKNTAYTDAATFKTAMNGVLLFYELATPIEVYTNFAVENSYKAFLRGTEEILFNLTSSTPIGVNGTIVKGYDISLEDQIRTAVDIDANQSAKIENLNKKDVTILNNGSSVAKQSTEENGDLIINTLNGVKSTYDSTNKRVKLESDLKDFTVTGYDHARGQEAGKTYNGLNAVTTTFGDGLDTNVSGSSVTVKLTDHSWSSGTGYGKGTTANFGHVKTQSGDMNGTSSTDGIAAGLGHTHSNYASSSHNHDTRYVRFDTASQGLTDAQKSNARTNIYAAPISHATNDNTYGLGTTSLYGHNKIKDGEILNKNIHLSGTDSSVDEYTDGITSSGAHTHFDLNSHLQTIEDKLLVKGVRDYNLSLDSSGIAQIKEKLGNVICVNQLNKNPNFNSDTNWNINGYTNSINDGVVTLTATQRFANIYQTNTRIKGHTYLFIASVKKSANATNIQAIQVYDGDQWHFLSAQGSDWKTYFLLITQNNTDTLNDSARYCQDNRESGWDTFYAKDFYCIDLTQWYNGNDNIPADLLANPSNFFRYYQGSLAYNEGQLVASNGQVIKSIGRNAWDEEWENGRFNNDTGAKELPSGYETRIRTKYPIRVIPNRAYYRDHNKVSNVYFYDKDMNYISYFSANESDVFTTPANCEFINFFSTSGYGSSTYQNDITISLYYEGESGYDQYYPYEVLAEVDTGSEVLRSAGSVYDKKLPSGEIIRNVGVYTFTGNESGGTQSGYPYISIGTPIASNDITMADFQKVSFLEMDNLNEKTMTVINGNTGMIGFYSSATQSLSDLRTYLTGKTVYFALKTPTTEQGTPFAETLRVNNSGTLQTEANNFNGVPMATNISYAISMRDAVDIIGEEVSKNTEAIYSPFIQSGSSVTDSPVISVVKNGSKVTVTKSNDISLSSLSILNAQNARIEIRKGSGDPWKIGIRNLDLNTGELSLYQGTETQTPFIRVSDASNGKIELYKDLDVNGFIREYAKSGSTTLTSLQDKYAYKIPLQNTIPTDRDYKAGDLWFDTTS